MECVMKKSISVMFAVLSIGFGLAPPSAGAMTRRVDCDKGETIAAAIEKSESRAERLEVFVSGTCDENLVIRRSEVTIDGGGAMTIRGQVSVFAHNVWLYNLTVTAPGRGVTVSDGSARLWSVALEENEGEGLLLRRNAFVWLRDSFVTNNVSKGVSANGSQIDVQNTSISGNGSGGVFLDIGSRGNFNDNEISDNSGSGITASGGSQVLIGGGNVITRNSEDGVLAQAGATVGVDGNTITENGGSGVGGYLGAVLVLHGNQITNNDGTGVYCRADCTLQVGGATISANGEHGIVVMLGSRLILEAPVTVATGNYGWVDLWCGDSESSVDGLADFFIGTSDGCTGFDD